MSPVDPFEGRLTLDLTVQLPSPGPMPRLRSGPLHRVEYVIEMVGPYAVPGSSAGRLLDADWYEALERPSLWAMVPGEPNWTPLNQSAAAFDSLAATWPLAHLNSDQAESQLKTLQPFADAIRRQTVPAPRPSEVDGLARDLRQLRDELDVGVSFTFWPSGRWLPEKEVWIVCANAGLEFSPEGSFDWKGAGHPLPLFSVTPLGETSAFSLGQVQAGAVHQGLQIGFSLPRCPSPPRAIEGALRFGRLLCERFGGRLKDEQDRYVDARIAAEAIGLVQQGYAALSRAKIVPGSSEALALFTGE